MDFLLKIPDVAEVEEKDGEVTLVRAAPMQCDNHVKELVANQVRREGFFFQPSSTCSEN